MKIISEDDANPMKKLLTFSPEQAKLLDETMKATYQSSVSALMVYLMVYYKDDANRIKPSH